HLTRDLSLDEVVEAVQEGLDAGVTDAARSGHSIRVGQLVTAMRHADRGLEIAELAVRHRDNGVVGFDFAGAGGGSPRSRARAASGDLAAQNIPATSRAGAAEGLDSIRRALVAGRALRLGQGVRIAEDVGIDSSDDEATYVTLGRLSQWVKDREIA